MTADKQPDGSVVKGLSFTPAITALLKPTAEYLGTELRDYVKATVEELKSKRRDRNINAHLEAVRAKLTDQPPPKSQAGPSFSQLALFDEWIEKAQDIDPEDKDLSDIWRNLLIKAARGETVPTEVVAALKSLSPKEAQFLVQLQKRIPQFPFLRGWASAEDRYLANALEAKSILEKDYAIVALFLSLLGLSGVYVYYSFGSIALVIGVAVAIAFVAVAFTMMRSDFERWRLTWLGRELMEFVSSRRRRHSADDPEQSVAADVAAPRPPR